MNNPISPNMIISMKWTNFLKNTNHQNSHKEIQIIGTAKETESMINYLPKKGKYQLHTILLVNYTEHLRRKDANYPVSYTYTQTTFTLLSYWATYLIYIASSAMNENIYLDNFTFLLSELKIELKGTVCEQVKNYALKKCGRNLRCLQRQLNAYAEFLAAVR